MSAAALQLVDVSLRIDGAAILEGVDLRIDYGRVVAVVGPNGAGKSSILSLLAGDQRPTSGRVLLDDSVIGDYRARELSRRRSVLLQSNEVTFGFTVAEVVMMGRSPWASAGDDDAIVRDALARADVAHLAERRFSSLSGGEKARTSLARVLAQDARIVMLDEPTAALDLRHQEDVLRTARGLAADGRAVVVVLHDLSLAAAYADDVAMIAEGRMAAWGTPAEVFTAERVEQVYGTPVRILEDADTGRPIVLPRRAI